MYPIKLGCGNLTKMHISIFPEELLVEIFSYLELNDLLSCCLVNKAWREAGNTNSLWFKLCSSRSPVQKKNFELIEASQLVDPVYSPLNQTCGSLSEVCCWRERFMQEARISRNWRSGRFLSCPVTRSTNPLSTECDDDILVVLSMDTREFSTYDVSLKPKLIQISHFSLGHMFADFFKLCGGKLVVVQCTLLQVFSKNDVNNVLDLTHRLLFNKKDKDSEYIPQYPNISEWYNSTVGLYPSDINIDCDHNGEHFVGFMQDFNPYCGIFHIWDLNTGHKVAEQDLPSVDGIIVNIHFSLHSSNLYILLKISNGETEYTTIQCFDLKSLKYSSMKLAFSYVVPIVLFGAKLLLNTDNSGKRLWMWRNRDGSLLHKISCDFSILPATLQFAASLVIFAGNSSSEYSGIVRVFNTETLQDVCEISTDYRVNNLLFVRGDLILVCGWMQLGLWDIKSRQKVHSFEYQDCLWLSSCGLKALVENDDELILLRFW